MGPLLSSERLMKGEATSWAATFIAIQRAAVSIASQSHSSTTVSRSASISVTISISNAVFEAPFWRPLASRLSGFQLSVAPRLEGLPVPSTLLAKLLACFHLLAGQSGLLLAQRPGVPSSLLR